RTLPQPLPEAAILAANGPQRDLIRPQRALIRPKRDHIRPKRDHIRPKRDHIRPKRDHNGPAIRRQIAANHGNSSKTEARAIGQTPRLDGPRRRRQNARRMYTRVWIEKSKKKSDRSKGRLPTALAAHRASGS